MDAESSVGIDPKARADSAAKYNFRSGPGSALGIWLGIRAAEALWRVDSGLELGIRRGTKSKMTLS